MGLINTLSDEALLAKNVMGELTMAEVWIGVKDVCKAVCISVRREEDVESLKSKEFWTNDIEWDISPGPGGCVWFNIYDTRFEDSGIEFEVAADGKVSVLDDLIYATDADGVDIAIQIFSKNPIPFSLRSRNA